jgi:hypothetical protein
MSAIRNKHFQDNGLIDGNFPLMNEGLSYILTLRLTQLVQWGSADEIRDFFMGYYINQQIRYHMQNLCLTYGDEAVRNVFYSIWGE